MRDSRLLRISMAAAAPFLLAIALLSTSAAPAAAYEFEGSALENAIANTLDVALIRPLASARVLVGGVLFLPAALLSSPGGQESFNSAYEIFIGEPSEYAFERKLGDL